MKIKSKEPKGIGGWLLIPIAMLIWNSVVLTIDLYYILVERVIQDIGLVLIFSEGVLLFFSIMTLYMIFNHSKDAPTWTIVTILLALVDKVLMHIYLAPNEYLIYGIGGVILWIAYFRMSKRVKNTFIK